MSTTREEATASIGIDHSTVARSLHALESTVEGFGHRVVHSFKHFGAGILAGFGIHAIVEKMYEAIEVVEQMSNRAAALKVSPSFMQDVENVGKAGGKSQQSMEKMLTTFARGLPIGSDVEKSFFAMIDSLNAIPDASERARIAFKQFGKAGADMLDIAGQGSEKFRELAGSLKKFSDEEIRLIKESKEHINQFNNTVVKGSGGVLAALQDMSNRLAIWGEAFHNLWKKKAGESLLDYIRRNVLGGSEEMEAEIERLTKSHEHHPATAPEGLTEDQNAALFHQLEILKALVAAKEKEQEMDRVKLNAAREIARIQQASLDKFKPTLDELARHGIFSGTARGIERLDRRIKRDFERGNTGAAEAEIGQRNRMFDSLVARGVLGERDEPRQLREIQQRTEQHLADIVRGNIAILVKAKMGD